MAQRAKQNFLHGALILVVGTIIVKIIGAVYKIPITNLLGGTGFGYFNTAYNLFNPIYALAVAGLPVAVARMVSENMAKKRYRDIRRIMGISSSLFFVTGSIGLIIMLLGSNLFVKMVGNQEALVSVLVMAPSVFFCCIMSAYRGYYEGMRNMYPTAISQIIEAVAKLIFGVALAYLMIHIGLNQYETTKMVFGKAVSSLEEAKQAVLPYASAGAIGGVTLSTFVGALYLWIRHRIRGDGISKEEMRASPAPRSSKTLTRQLIRIAIPVCLGALVLNLTSLIDLTTLMNRMQTAMNRNSAEFLKMYQGLIPAGMEQSRIPNYLYGSYNAALTIFNLVPAITTTFGVSALPNVASAWAVRNLQATKRNVESVLRVTSLIAVPAGLALFALSGPILSLLFPSRPQEAAIAAPMLQVLGIAVIFVSMATPINSILQAIGQEKLPVRFMLVGGSLKLIINFIFVAIPGINIHSAPYGTVACYAFIVLAALIALSKCTGIRINFLSVFVKPLVAGGLCAASAWVSHSLLGKVIGSPSIVTVLAILIGVFVYALSILLIRGIARDDVAMLPKGEKIAKILEKRGLIG